MPGRSKIQKKVSVKRPTKRDADTESLEQAVAAPTLALALPSRSLRRVTVGLRWTSVRLSKVHHHQRLSRRLPTESYLGKLSLVQFKPAFMNVYERSTTYTNVYFQTSAKVLHVKKFQQT